jgi:tRNA pseudouridine55 synthase
VDGVLVLDKPRGPTSHDVVARVRRALGTRSVGHAGTLDPMATGVLVIAVGEATKLVPFLTAERKSYTATIALGRATDTLDADGAVVEEKPVPVLTSGRRLAPAVIAALEAERARKEQVPPAHSAIKDGGERAYAKARRGEVVELAPRPVEVYSLQILEHGEDWLAVSLDVAKGYYVRSLARDLAAGIGTVGHLSALRRTRSGSFTLDEALTIETPGDELEARLMPLAHAAMRALPFAQLTERGARDARHGKAVRAEDLDTLEPGPHAWIDPAGALVAVGALEADGRGKVLRGFTSSPP